MILEASHWEGKQIQVVSTLSAQQTAELEYFQSLKEMVQVLQVPSVKALH